MQRIQYHQYGGPEVMRLEAYDLPTPKTGEVVVRVKAASVNPLDWKLRQGFMKLIRSRHFPKAMGMDFAGIVDVVGPGVTNLAAGDAVLGSAPMTSPGAFAERVITTADLVIKSRPRCRSPTRPPCRAWG